MKKIDLWVAKINFKSPLDYFGLAVFYGIAWILAKELGIAAFTLVLVLRYGK